MAAMNKSLAENNKSRTRGKATKKRWIPAFNPQEPAPQSRRNVGVEMVRYGCGKLGTMIYNGLVLLPLIFGLVTSCVSGRVTLTLARGGVFREIDARRHIVWSIIGGLSVVAQLILWVSAFFVLWWPIAIPLILILLIVPAFFVTSTTLAFLTALQPMLNLITVALTAIVLWLVIA
jgi:hypothetical protein